jgi:hypothetical protein
MTETPPIVTYCCCQTCRKMPSTSRMVTGQRTLLQCAQCQHLTTDEEPSNACSRCGYGRLTVVGVAPPLVKASSAVNHPSHYNSHPAGIECIDVVEHMTFNIGNAIKYLWRAGLKPNAPSDQDIAKAQWYLERELSRLRASQARHPASSAGVKADT